MVRPRWSRNFWNSFVLRCRYVAISWVLPRRYTGYNVPLLSVVRTQFVGSSGF